MKLEQLKQILANLTACFAKLGNSLSEEQVFRLVIDPIIDKVWDFRYAPSELNEAGTFDTEVKTMVGHDTKVFLDRLLICHNGKKLAIEGKGTNVSLDNFVGQLETSVIASGASVGILWNGTELRIYLTTTDGKMDLEPYKTIYLMVPSAEDLAFLANFFDPKHTINDAQMKRERDVRRKNEKEQALDAHIIKSLIDKVLQPSIDAIKEPYKEFMHQTQVQTGTLQATRDRVAPKFLDELKSRLVGDAIADEKRKDAMKNKIEPEEFAIANLLEYEADKQQCKLEWIDDDDASRSIMRRADSKKTVLWIVGEISADGYKFKGVALPNINKTRGKLIPITDPKEVVRGELFNQVIEVYDHINDSVDAWKTFFTANFGE